MEIPVYLWLYEEEGKLIKGSVDVTGREGSIECVGMQHDLFIPTDDATGKATGTRQEENYFTVTLENVKVCHVVPVMYDTKDPDFEKQGHIEHVGLRYEKIDWHYTDGNIKHADSWNERKTA